MKASQAVSGEIVLENLIKTLMMIAVEHAGAERGLLILPHGEEHRIEAEAKTGRDEVEVHLRQALVTPIELPESLLRYVIRTQESVILDDALVEKLFSEDEYVRQRRPRSVLCLPLVKQANLVGVLYLENTLAPRVFTPNRFAMLELLASQAAISLDHAQLYAELGRLNAELAKAKERLRLVVDTTPAMMQSALPDGSIDFFNRRWLEFFGLPLEKVRGWKWTSAVHPEDAPAFVEKWRMALKTGEAFEAEARCRRADGTYRWLFHRKVPLRDERGNIIKWYGSSIDINERKVAEEDLRRSEAFLAEAQRLSHTGSFGWNVSTDEHFWSDETFRIFEYDASIKLTSALIFKRVHPQDIALVQQIIALAADWKDFDYECRLLMPSGSVKHVRLVAHAVREESGNAEFIGAVMDVTAEKSSQQALKGAFQEVQALKNQFRLAVDTIPELVWTSLPDGHVDFFNQRWLEYTGLTLEEAGGWGWQAAIHPEDLAGLVDYWKSLLAFGKPGETEARMRRCDGEYRWFLLRAVPLYDGTGRIVKWYGTITDIEERKQAEDKFRRSEAFLAEGQRLSHTGGWGWNAASGELTWSQEHFRILGLDSERTKPSLEMLWERVHPEDRPGLMQAFDSAVRDKRDFEKEYRIVTPDGVIRHLHNVGHAVVNEANELVEFVGTTMDITDRNGAEEALRESEQRLQDIVDNTTAIIFVKDSELRYVLVNREYERLHHVQRDQIRGKTDFDILPHDVAEAVRDNDRRVIEAGVPIEFEQTVPWEDGERDYVVSKFLLHDHTEKPYAVCGVATDITELKRVGEMQAALARERELFAEQRAAEMAKANEALRGCLDALAAVPELDEFIGQVMATITRQLGADSSALRLLNSEKKAWVLELLSEDGRVMTPAEAKIPERWRSVSLDEPTVTAFLDRPMTVIRLLEPAPMREDWHSYLLTLGVKAVVAIPLIGANTALQKMLGYTEEELQGLTPLDVILEEDRAAAAARLAESAEGRRRAHCIETRYVRKDGGVIWADASGGFVPATGSSPAFFAWVIVDITERKRAEEALRESEQQLRDIVDNTTAAIFVKDLELRYVLVNREFERLYHIEREQIRGKTDFDIHPHDIAEAVRANDRLVIEAGEPIQFEEAVSSDRGERLYVSSNFLLHDCTGQPYAVCGIATDITALKRPEEMQSAIASEQEIFAKQRAAELAKANGALRGCLDALASVPELDDFLGQVMAAISRQLGAASSTLRMLNLEQNTLTLELLFQDGRVMSPAEAKYPEDFRSLSLNEQRVATLLDKPTTVIRILSPRSLLSEDHCSYLLGLSIKTLLIIPLTLGGRANGQLDFRFTEERDFSPEELEIARALATKAAW